MNCDSIDSLLPNNYPLPQGGAIHYFVNPSLQLVKLDLTFEAGTAWQSCLSQAHAANQLFGEATRSHSAEQMAEFMDFRGIIVERNTEVCTSSITFYFLRRYAEELLAMIRLMFDEPLITVQLFSSYKAQRMSQLQQNLLKTSISARNEYYRLLFGDSHPLGVHATADDIEHLTFQQVEEFLLQHYHLGGADITVAGAVDDSLLDLIRLHLAPQGIDPKQHGHILPPPSPQASSRDTVREIHDPRFAGVQNSLRIGTILPFHWDEMDYARFLVLNTVLGGYFGSRLMTNIREDKGYTYGIYSHTQMFRGCIVFYITADIAADSSERCLSEIKKEIARLQQEPVGKAELDRVRHFMHGEHIRSLDGIFELSERYRQMSVACVTEQFTSNYLEAIRTTTPDQLLTLAQSTLSDLLFVTVGA